MDCRRGPLGRSSLASASHWQPLTPYALARGRRSDMCVCVCVPSSARTRATEATLLVVPPWRGFLAGGGAPAVTLLDARCRQLASVCRRRGREEREESLTLLH